MINSAFQNVLNGTTGCEIVELPKGLDVNRLWASPEWVSAHYDAHKTLRYGLTRCWWHSPTGELDVLLAPGVGDSALAVWNHQMEGGELSGIIRTTKNGVIAVQAVLMLRGKNGDWIGFHGDPINRYFAASAAESMAAVAAMSIRKEDVPPTWHECHRLESDVVHWHTPDGDIDLGPNGAQRVDLTAPESARRILEAWYFENAGRFEVDSSLPM